MSETTTQTGRVKYIDFLKVALSVGIVLRHAELVGIADRTPASGLLNSMGMLFSELFVPMFFVLSGYLFFRNVPEKPTPAFFGKKLYSRVFSLLIPYLIANVLAFGCYWAAYRYAPSMMSGFFGDDWKNPLFVFWSGPVNLSLWFIRDLMIALILSPIIWLFVRYTRIWGVLALGLVWYFHGIQPWYNFYFILGAWAAVWKVDVSGICRKTGPWWIFMYVCTFAAALRNPALKSFTMLSGFPMIIYFASLLTEICDISLKPQWQAWCFFMYLYHYIPELALKKVLEKMIDPQTTGGLILTFVLLSLLTLGIVSFIYWLLKKLAPRVTGVLVGGKL